MKRLIFAFIAFVFNSMPSYGAETNVYTTIVNIYSYTQYGGGDVVVQVATPASTCANGYWLKASDAGFKSTLAVLLSAYHAGARIRIGGVDTELWTGSSGTYCRISFAAIVPS